MLCGCQRIAKDVGGMRDFVHDRINVFLVQGAIEELLNEAMNRLGETHKVAAADPADGCLRRSSGTQFA
jgi:glycosyltransferase involved in cell wall biosynthesis